ncbi:MAG: alpha/beta hydrolase-fold protein [Myxococcaceae bacterium]
MKFLILALIVAAPALAQRGEPLTFGTSYRLVSKNLRGEAKHLNVLLPPDYEKSGAKYPVLYLLDGGADQDFFHIAGLVQILIGNGSMAPLILVGVESGDRKRDLTFPTKVPDEQKLAKVVGQSADYRSFFVTEVFPFVERTFRTTGERGLMGESLAGLFVLETFFLAPNLFDAWLAVSPSLWWNEKSLVKDAAVALKKFPTQPERLVVAVEEEDFNEGVSALQKVLEAGAPKSVNATVKIFPGETHGTVFHPAALDGLRRLFPGPPPAK